MEASEPPMSRVSCAYAGAVAHSAAESVTRQCPKPVLVTPLEFSEIRSPLLAYDGSQRASAAMQVAAEVCSQLALPLSVLAVCREAEQGDKILAVDDTNPAGLFLRLGPTTLTETWLYLWTPPHG